MAEENIESENFEEPMPWDGGYVRMCEKLVDNMRYEKSQIKVTNCGAKME